MSKEIASPHPSTQNDEADLSDHPLHETSRHLVAITPAGPARQPMAMLSCG